ncbi:MAG: glycosyltransferase family 4 protein [Thermodesulfobacteriota bacterium]|nr:glycosyltransferase family 4 protein [Thermodesulfobacteriota bacterium]
MHIVSPIAQKSGAYRVHNLLECHLPDYCVKAFNPYWTVFPPILPAVVSLKGADLIHSTPDYAVFFYLTSVPLVITFHGYVIDGRLSPYSSWLQNLHHITDLRLWTRLALRKAHTITAVSEYLATHIREDLGISQSIKVIYNGVDINCFSPERFEDSFRNEIRVFFPGNLTRRKGAHFLPSIANLLKKNVSIFYTKGFRGRNFLSSNPRLKCMKSVPFETMPDCYRYMDILLVPSVREGFGLTIAEAMACGLPVVASNCSAIPELIENEKGGFLCPVGDVNAFAEKINVLADSPKLRREMGEYNRAKVERLFVLERMVSQYKELFESIMDDKKHIRG